MSPVRIDPAGVPFVAGAVILAVVAGAVAGWWYALPLLLLAAIFLYFFRDPERQSPHRPDAVLSPADGKVLVAGPALPGIAPPGSWQQVSIFLSPLDVHVNRIPASGKVTSVSYMPGRFLPAYRHDAATDNERSEIWIERDGQHIVARQIVGMLARRVVCRVQPGAEVRAGDRFGVMKFGSRMDVFVPVTAELCVRVGDAVRGGETVIAVLH
jgi:phosphatidylserine decarboxylase